MGCSCFFSTEDKRNTLQAKDLRTAVYSSQCFDFLIDVIDMFEEGEASEHELESSTGSHRGPIQISHDSYMQVQSHMMNDPSCMMRMPPQGMPPQTGVPPVTIPPLAVTAPMPHSTEAMLMPPSSGIRSMRPKKYPYVATSAPMVFVQPPSLYSAIEPPEQLPLPAPALLHSHRNMQPRDSSTPSHRRGRAAQRE